MKNLRIIIPILSVLLIFGLTLPVQAIMDQNVNIPVNIELFTPCARPDYWGWGSNVWGPWSNAVILLSGNEHVFATFTYDVDGTHGNILIDPQEIRGIDTVTGDVYHGTGITEYRFNGNAGTFINRFNIISLGSGNNYIIQETIRFTINADGTITASVGNIFIEC